MESSLKILVTGAGGQLGHCFRRLAPSFPAFDVVFLTHLELDVTVESWVEKAVSTHRPAAIIHCAAYTNVEKAETDPEEADLVNSIAVRYLAEACHRHQVLLVHFSTDYVFDGTSTLPYQEADSVSPLSIYGRTKLEGERIIDEIAPRHITIRTSWLYSEYGHNFYRTMVRLAKQNGELRVVNDQVSAPTYAGDLALDVFKLLVQLLVHTSHIDYGTYHYAPDGETSWFGFAAEIVNQLGLNVPVLPLQTGDFPAKAQRPAYSKLDNSKWKKNTGLVLTDWQTGLKHCLANEKRIPISEG